MDNNYIPDYPTNSYKSKQPDTNPEKKINKVVDDVKVKKKTGFSKFKEALISDDTGSVKSYILNDVLIPSFKKAISDIVTNGIDIILYGESRHSSKSNNGSRISYTSYYNRESDNSYRSTRSGYDYNNIVVSSKAEAERVLEALDDVIASYGIASVADFYDLVGVTGQYTDNNYGWRSITTAKSVPTRDGWLIVLPKAMPIRS